MPLPRSLAWTGSLMSDRQVKLVLDGGGGRGERSGHRYPSRSPAAPIIFATYMSGIFGGVVRAVPGVSGLSFVDNIELWAEGKGGKDGKAVAAMLTRAAAAFIDWAASNGVAFDHEKTEAAVFLRRKTPPTEVWANSVPFNKEVTRWLGVWIDSQLILKDHHAIRLKNGKNAPPPAHRAVGLLLANCREVRTAYIQSVAAFGPELWRKGEQARGSGK